MKAAKCTFFRRVTGWCPSVALMLTMLIVIVAATTTAAQNVFVPGNASGFFGNPADQANPLVVGLTVSGPGTITVTYVSGKVNWDVNIKGCITGPNGSNKCTWCTGNQTPLDEARGIGLGEVRRIGALIGVFVPQSRVLRNGFNAIDGTKDATKVGIIPNGLFFIGTGKSIPVSEAGTLFLGINDYKVGDNSGGFNVTVSGP